MIVIECLREPPAASVRGGPGGVRAAGRAVGAPRPQQGLASAAAAALSSRSSAIVPRSVRFPPSPKGGFETGHPEKRSRLKDGKLFVW